LIGVLEALLHQMATLLVYAYLFFVGWDSTIPLHLKDVFTD